MEKNVSLKKNQDNSKPVVDVEVTHASKINKTDLSSKETRQIVTPYAFFVADELLGTPLAGPFRRGFGLAIDLLFVSLLTQVSSLVLAGVAAWTFFKAGNRLQTKKRFNSARIFLRLLVALLLFIVAMGIVDSINENEHSDSGIESTSDANDKFVKGLGLVALSTKYIVESQSLLQQIEQGACEPAYDCLQNLGEKIIRDVVAAGLSEKATQEVLEAYVEGVSDEISKKNEKKLQLYLSELVESEGTTNTTNESGSSDVNTTSIEDTKDGLKKSTGNGILDWLENLFNELGLGLGWAAFYFSVFTAWWKGQTPGKKLMGMKVIKLDNQPLSLFESFGRYGGYAAGLATGLMGFLQVFWDPNRQAIQDKISETLVIDLRKPKVPFEKTSA